MATHLRIYIEEKYYNYVFIISTYDKQRPDVKTGALANTVNMRIFLFSFSSVVQGFKYEK